MKNDQYFRMETNMLTDERMHRLTERHGQQGFGAYILLLLELRKCDKYKCGPYILKGISRSHQVDMELLESIINDFGLFTISGAGDKMRISSSYLNRVMKPLEENRKRMAKQGKANAARLKRADNGRFTVTNGAEEKSKEEQSKAEKSRKEKSKEETTTTVVVIDDAGISSSSDSDKHPDMLPHVRSWQEYLEEAVTDEEWMALLAMSSGVSVMFCRHRELIIQAFRDHVELQATGANIRSHKDLRSYFVNFLRPGTVTHKRVMSLINEREEQLQANPAHRFETLDPATGGRTYFGNPIPADAPPRPNNTALWSEGQQKWI